LSNAGISPIFIKNASTKQTLNQIEMTVLKDSEPELAGRYRQ